MSNYTNFIQDFPVRCGKILGKYKDTAEKSGLEVTLLISIAAAALPIPFERLRKPVGGIKHPSNDKNKYIRAVGKFGNLCDKNFLGSDLWGNDPGSWCWGQVAAELVSKEPESWTSASIALPNNLKNIDVLDHLRNALAHGNIFTLPDSSDKIQEIIFLNRRMENKIFLKEYYFLRVSPIDFNEFLINWIAFLQELKLPNEI